MPSALCLSLAYIAQLAEAGLSNATAPLVKTQGWQLAQLPALAPRMPTAFPNSSQEAWMETQKQDQADPLLSFGS